MKEYVSVREALRIVLESVYPLAADRPVETVPLLDSVGRTLAADIRSMGDHPPFPNSAMDGFAVGVAGGLESGPYRIVGESRAGYPYKGRLHAGEAIRIATGAAVPEGTHGVVPIEHVTEQEESTVSFRAAPARHAHVRPPGRDVGRGDLAFRRGTAISRAAIPMLAMLGIAQVPVVAKPTVFVITTGDELEDVGHPEPLGPGKIRDSNAMGIAAMVTAVGGRIVGFHRAADTPADLQRALANSAEAEIVLISGGVSVGVHDHARAVLGMEGVELAFWRVRQRPGKPLAFGKAGRKIYFALPGNPVSSAICFHQYVRPAIHRLLQQVEGPESRAYAVLEQTISTQPGLYHFVRGTAQTDAQARLRVQETGAQDSNLISSIVRANCLIHVPEEASILAAGDLVEIEWFRY